MSFVVGQYHPRFRQRARDLRAKQHAEVQAGKWAGASPVRTLTPEERAAYEAALLARDAPKPLPWTTPAPEPKPEPEEGSMTNLERARSLRAELEQAQKTIADKRREALAIADELEQEAAALRQVAGAVPVKLVASFPPPPRRKPIQKRERFPTPKPNGGYGSKRARILAALKTTPTSRAEVVATVPDIIPQVVATALAALVKQGRAEKVGPALYRRVA